MQSQSIALWHSFWRAVSASLGVVLLLSLLGWVSLSQSTYAQSDLPLETLDLIQVETNNPSINDNDLCSIIEAIENANADAVVHDDCAAGNGNDTISLPNDAVVIFTTTHNSIGGANALPVITSAITILGNGTTLVRDVNTAPNFRFFNVDASGSLTLVELGLRNGIAELSGTTQLLLGGGAIVNQGTLNVVNSNISYNRASYGGAIYSQPVSGTMSLVNTTFSFNVADLFGGAVYNLGPATVNGGILRYNQAAMSGGALLHSSGLLTVTNATVLDNISGGVGAGIATYAGITNSNVWISATNIISNVAALNGGGLYNSASNSLTSHVEIAGSHITANRATSTADDEGIGGGAVNGWVTDGSGGVAEMVIHQSFVADNVAQAGGGIANLDATGYTTRTAQLSVSQSAFTRNTAAGIGSERGFGGGLLNRNGAATVVNSTVSGNQALGDDVVMGGRGGGIGNSGEGITTTLQVLNSTIAYNEAAQAGGGIAVLGPISTTSTTWDVGNTLIVSNVLTVTESISNQVVLAAIAVPQVITGTESCSIENGSTNSLGGNIEDGTSCGLNNSEDLTSTLVALGPLQNNGGPTATHLITENGAAYNRGIDALCSAAPVNGVDQRGVARPQEERCDVGAVELVIPPPESPVIRFPAIFYNYSLD